MGVSQLFELQYKIPQTKYLINNTNVFFTALETGSPRSGDQHGHILVGFQVFIYSGYD